MRSPFKRSGSSRTERGTASRARAAAPAIVAVVVLAGGAQSAAAGGTVTAAPGPATTLVTRFEPYRLGSAATVSFQLLIDPAPQTPALPLETVEVMFPRDLGLATSGLGVASCQPATLEELGPSACPANAKMGSGRAVVELPFGPELVIEEVPLAIYAAPSPDGYIHLAILASGKQPVQAVVVINAVLYPGRLAIAVPSVPGLPGGPDVALLAIHAAIGAGLTYYERRDGRDVAYRPRGIGLPGSCPRGGFQMGARFRFSGGESSYARSAVACPRKRTAG